MKGRFRSTWELAFSEWANRPDSPVKHIEYEPVSIDWFLCKRRRTYVPDFICELHGGSFLMVELKCSAFINALSVILKKRAAETMCRRMREEGFDIEYIVLTEIELSLYCDMKFDRNRKLL